MMRGRTAFKDPVFQSRVIGQAGFYHQCKPHPYPDSGVVERFDSGCQPFQMLESTRLADLETTEWSPGRIQVESGIENIEFP